MPRLLLSLLALVLSGASATAYVPSEFEADYSLGYDSGYEVGYVSGYGSGEKVGTTTGKREGKTEGFDAGWEQAYQPAYDASYNDHFDAAFDAGYRTAFVVSYDDGAVAGIEYVDELLQTAQQYAAAYQQVASGMVWASGPFGPDTGPSKRTPGGGSNGSIEVRSDVYVAGPDWWAIINEYGADHYYRVGYDTGKRVGHGVGYDLGYEEGYGPAYEAAYAVALDDGILQGDARGLLEGGWAGTNEGWVDGVADGDEDGYAYGFEDGLAVALDSLNPAELNAIDSMPISLLRAPAGGRSPLDPWSLGVVPVPEPATALLVLCVVAAVPRLRGSNE